MSDSESISYKNAQQVLPLAKTVACSDDTVTVTADTASVSQCLTLVPPTDSTSTGHIAWGGLAAADTTQ